MAIQFTAAKRCSSCGISLIGKPAYRVRDQFFCTTVRCLSRAYTENFHDLIPVEEEKLAEAMARLRIRAQSRYTAAQSCGA